MRYKFRAWDIFHKKFVWGEYSEVANNMDEFWSIVKGGENSGREVPLMQYTGLLDKNGKEIYESDIVYIPHRKEPFVVKFPEDYSYLANRGEKQLVEVIGDIHSTLNY